MPDQRPTLETALAAYNRQLDAEQVAKGRRAREDVLARFPLDQWPTLPLARYALGQDDSSDTFCHWMEYRTPYLGSIGGGSARKLIIYKHRDKPGWYFDPQYKDEQEAWEKIREAFVQAFEKGRGGDWNTIVDLAPLSGGPALLLKTLHLYFPDEVLPICSQAHLRHFLGLLERPEAGDHRLDVMRLNRALLDAVGRRSEFQDWSTNEVERFFYRWADPREGPRVVKIAPGENAKFWDDCLPGGYICVGWEKVGDLREFESKESFRARFDKEYAEGYQNHRPTLTRKANEVWTLMELEPGDVVIANQGTSKVLAVGMVVEPGYTWDTQRSRFNHTVRVAWDTSYEQNIEPQKKWALVTVANVPAALYATILRRVPPRRRNGGPVPPPAPLDRPLSDIAEALERKGQVILYGPPGTGKTYHARRFAVAWLLRQDGRGAEAQAALVDPAKLAAAERELSPSVPRDVAVGRLTRVTFHPSYSYEDFVEGFRPHESGDAGLALRLADGVFKRVCRAALGQPQQRFLVLVDEINRANVAKVFGELVTLLETDKRGLMVTLPQSKESFCVPPNVYLLGTMNTADRSIKLLDAALRRRFAFVELMPDSEVLHGGKVGTLALDDFLDALNRRIAKNEGREKQIGHAFLLEGDQPIDDPEEFARRFRQEILPLLQEYCYDDYGALAAYIGDKLVDKEGQTLRHEHITDADALLTALEEEFGRS